MIQMHGKQYKEPLLNTADNDSGSYMPAYAEYGDKKFKAGDDYDDDEYDDDDNAHEIEVISGVYLTGHRQMLARFLEHIGVLLIVIMLIVLSLILLIVDAIDDTPLLEALNYVILSIFLVEIALRVYTYREQFVYNIWNVVDAVAVVCTLILSLLLDNVATHALLALRLSRVVLIITRLRAKQTQVAASARSVISMNKQRYQRDGFDLDLVYITPRIIAMSVPAINTEQAYRNPIAEVVRFFDTKHPNHYMIYNVTQERRSYSPAMFHNRVRYYAVADHNVPPLYMMRDFCENVERWMNADPLNMIAVHCRGGKGRTGTMVCAWLLYSGQVKNAQEAIDLYGNRRTDFTKGTKIQGIETPSQIRYVRWFESALKSYALVRTPVDVELLRLTFEEPPQKTSVWSGHLEWFRYNSAESVRFPLREPTQDHRSGPLIWDLASVGVSGDVKFTIHRNGKVFCYFWVHTSFIGVDRFTLYKDRVDRLHKDLKHHKRCSHLFRLHLDFRTAQ